MIIKENLLKLKVSKGILKSLSFTEDRLLIINIMDGGFSIEGFKG